MRGSACFMAERFLSIDPIVAKFVVVDETSPSLLRWCVDRGNGTKAGAIAGTHRPDGRWRVCICGRFYYTYRVYMYLNTKFDPVNLIVDHKNGDPANHASDNLRLATRSQNNANRRPRGKYKGVSLHVKSGLWRARLSIGKKETTTYHETEEAAARAYDVLALHAHGQFAYLNFPEKANVHP